MFSNRFYAKLDPLYRQELETLIKEIDDVKETTKEKSEIKVLSLLNDFSSKFLMPRKLWNEKIKRGNYIYDKQNLAAKCIYHFCYLTIPDRKFLRVPYLHDEKLFYCEDRELEGCYKPKKLTVENICFPHKNLDFKWQEYEQLTKSIIPRSSYRRYEKMKNLYSKIKLIRNNIEEWFKALLEAEDYDFVVDNVEYRLNLYMANKELWKLYIHFLEQNNHKKLLETYSKYCRFFLSDSEMLMKYKTATEKYGPSFVPWKNTFEFEIYDSNILTFNSPEVNPAPEKDASKCLLHYNSETALPQKFPFHSNLMNYIIKTATASILFDLFKSCKWFYSFYPIPICYNFHGSKFRNIPKIEQQKITIIYLSHLKIKNKIYISTIFFFNFYPNTVTALSKFIPKIYRCTAKYVHINEQNLSFQELKFLIGHGEVLDLYVFIKDQDGNQFKFEDILKLIPKIKKMDIIDTMCPPNIAQILYDFPFQNKIERLCFGDVKVLPDPYIFAEFILKNASQIFYSRFAIYGYCVHNNVEENGNKYKFRAIVEKNIGKKWKGHGFPEIMV